jgi:OmpA-OmpF porin, OOP family
MLREYTLPLAATLLVLWLGLGSWWYSATYCTAHAGAGIPGLSLMDGDFQVSAEQTFTFYESNPDPYLNESVRSAFEKLASHLRAHPDKELTLFGVYSPHESNSTGFDNLGQARADAIRNILMDLGVPKNSIKVKGGLFDNASFANRMMYGGVYFRFKNTNESPQEPLIGEENRSKDLFRPVNIYFDVNEYDLILTDELEAYLEDTKAFLQKNISAKIAIIGHADSKGNDSANMTLSENRARNVKKFMIRSGFDPKRLVIEFHGDQTPLSSESASEDLKKNRRVELRLLNR